MNLYICVWPQIGRPSYVTTSKRDALRFATGKFSEGRYDVYKVSRRYGDKGFFVDDEDLIYKGSANK